MKKLLLREAAKHKLQNRRRKRWQKTVSILACLVVFCTVYALILPALTAEADTYCGKEEHTHTEACYEDKLICGKEEGEGAHNHTDDCYREVDALVCQTPESDGHQHTDACYTEEQVLTCTNTEEGHVHSEFDGCYTTEKRLTCGMEEGEGAHHHTAECYEKKKELICGQQENDGHRHTAECYEKELICSKEEHTHTLACYSNPNADVENGDVWQNTVSSVTLTGNWGADLAAIAQTQTGYTESTANYTVAEDGQTIHGYTRYGAWANDPYRDNWSAQFADFCLSYAGVPTSAVPQNSDCSAWNYTIPDGYTPKTGDLLLLDTDLDGSADHAGIVTSVSDSTLTAIVGDADKAVRNNTYNIGSENIKGYVSIPENPALADDNHGEETTETTPVPEATEEPQETPTPEITEEPQETPTAPSKRPHKAPSKNSANTTTVDERITVNVTPKESADQGKNGKTLHANINSQYSSADVEGNVTVQIDISELPYGVTLAGFDNEKKMLVEYKNGETSKQMAVYLRTREDGSQYVEFEQPEGSTINFDLTFNSRNGVMDKTQSVTLTPSVVNKTDKDKVSNPIDLTWTGENKWSNLQKTVDTTKMSVDSSTNRLVGQLNYSISAQEQNADGGDDTGSIWTKEVRLNDSLTLPAGISFPEGAHIDNNTKTVVDGSGQILFSFANLDSSYINNLSLSADRKSVNYDIVIPNPNIDADGVPTEEMDGIGIGAVLDISKLTLADNYVSRSKDDIAADIIRNTVSIKTIAYKGDDTYEDTKSVESVPDVTSKIQFKKSHKNQKGEDWEWAEVKPGESIEYTITIKNTGTIELGQTDENNNPRTVIDTLPESLVLTEEQEAALKNLGANYDSESRRITWIPGPIKGGETKTLTFNVNVADAEKQKDLKTETIKNKAEFDGKSSETTIKYVKPEVTIEKVNYKINEDDIEAGQKVGNKDTIIYKITLTNNNASKSTSQTVTDVLQDGLLFKSMVDSGGNSLITASGEFNAEAIIKGTASKNGHKVKLEKSGQTLTWELKELEPYETVTMYLECEVDAENYDISTIKNKASTSDGKSGESGEIGVSNPITVDKKVKGPADTGYNDGGGTYGYGSGNCLDYSITINNAAGDKACQKSNLVLKDRLDRGLIPNYNLYKLKDSSTNKNFENGEITQDDLSIENDLTFQKYLTDQTIQGTGYYTVINNEVVKVFRDSNYVNDIFNGLELYWFIGKLDPDQSVTKTYQAYLYRTEKEEQTSGSVKPKFGNTAEINGTSDTVNVYGKVDKGSVVIRKEIQGSYGDDVTKLTEAQKEKISFKLKNKDTGAVVQEFTLKDFTETENGKIGKLKIDNLLHGTYIIEETSGTIDSEITSKVTVGRVNESGQFIGEEQETNSYEFTVDENTVNEYLGVKFVNKYSSVKQADIRKDVWAIIEAENIWSSNPLGTKEIFSKPKSDGKDVYVIYNITVANTGKESFEVSSIIDDLDDSGKLTFVGINQNSWPDNIRVPQQYVMTPVDQGNNIGAVKEDIDYTGNLKSFKISINQQTSTDKVFFDIQASDGGTLTLNRNEGISFFIMCKVDKSAPKDVYLNNTATLKVDSDVEYNPYGVIKTKKTPNDANQNNGDSWDDGYDENKTYHYISSSVSVKPTDSILPGITKSATGYVGVDKEIETIQNITNVKTNISSQSAVRWKIELLNDGTKAINAYTITDSVEAPFHILSKDEAEKMCITSEVIRKQYNVFTLEILNASGQRVGNVHDLSAKVWEKVTDAKQQSLAIDILENEGMSIPAGGKAIFTVYTNNTVFSNKIYTNTATFSPRESFKGSDVKTGQLITDENSKPTGVKAEANVYALGDYASFSWKTIEEDGNESNNAVGYDDKNNYITINGDSTNRTVIYTNNIENTSNNNFNKFVVIDLMPYSGDTGVFNQDSRSSEFKVNFIDDSMNIVITDSSGNVVQTLSKGSDYQIKYSGKTSFDNNQITSGTLGNEWHDSWNDKDKSFAIVFDEKIILAPRQTMKMQYNGFISNEAQPGQIAWNSFGYKYTAYNALKQPVDLRAEPPKVGVMIQKKPIIEKQVINSKGEIQSYDPSKTFTFTVYEGDSTEQSAYIGKFTLCQGGSEKLENLKKTDGSAMFVSGQTYTVVETDTNGCEFVNVGIKGDTSSTENRYTFKYESKVNKIDILFINKQQAEYVLPETGGTGTNRFTAVGLSLMAGSLMCEYVMRRKRRERRGK